MMRPIIPHFGSVFRVLICQNLVTEEPRNANPMKYTTFCILPYNSAASAQSTGSNTPGLRLNSNFKLVYRSYSFYFPPLSLLASSSVMRRNPRDLVCSGCAPPSDPEVSVRILVALFSIISYTCSCISGVGGSRVRPLTFSRILFSSSL